MMQKKKFLITGAAGFLGANLVERVVADGHSVLAMDNLSMGKLANLEGLLGRPGVEFLQADVTQSSAFEKVAGDYDVIVHLAAFKIPRYGKAIDTLKINYQGTENALEYARRTGCKAVLASTSDVYGRNPKLPFSEEGSDSVIGSSKSPRWAYAVSKLFDEHLGLAYADAYGFPVTILRFFGSYGPRQHLSWWAGPQSVFIDCVLNDKPIPVHGDGLQTRSQWRDHQHRQHAGNHDPRAGEEDQTPVGHARRAEDRLHAVRFVLRQEVRRRHASRAGCCTV
jgi:UDP-glucose 4-epimerase